MPGRKQGAANVIKIKHEQFGAKALNDLQHEVPAFGADEFYDLANTNKVDDKKTEEFKELPIKIGEKKLVVHDPLMEVNLGSDDDKRSIFISIKLSAEESRGIGQSIEAIQGLFHLELLRDAKTQLRDCRT